MEEAPSKTCQHCRYWGRRVPHWNTRVHKTCDSPYIRHGGQHLLPALEFPESAVLEAHEGWGGLFGPSFGCIHWQALPESQPPVEHPWETMARTEEAV